jgi:D-alanyl-D-alanine carboxypeptidase
MRFLSIAAALAVAWSGITAGAAGQVGEGGAGGFTPPADFSRTAGEYMQARAQVTGFSGAILVAQGGKPLFRGAYGLADRTFDVPNTVATKFRVGSVSKQFTAAAVVLLEQRERLSLGDPVGRYIPDWPAAWAAVTLHHLLSHTAGLPRLTTRSLLDVSALSVTMPAPFREFRDLHAPGEELQPLDFEPGTRFAYSNVGYILLAMVIEKASGLPYCDFVQQEMFQPLGMVNTGCEAPGTIVKQQARGYNRMNDTLVNAGFVDLRLVVGAGSITSTLDDLLLWDRALTSDRLLTASARAKLFIPVQNGYGLGWWIGSQYGHPEQSHGGNLSGAVAQIARYPAEDLFVVVVSNVWSSIDRSRVRAIANELAAMAFRVEYELPREHRPVTLSPSDLDAYVGKYYGRDTFALAREGDQLVVQFPPGQTVMELVPESATAFFAKGREYFLTLVRDDTGRVARARARHEGEAAEWTRANP